MAIARVVYDCGIVIVRGGEALRKSMTINADYLPSDQSNPSDYTPEVSRRPRGPWTPGRRPMQAEVTGTSAAHRLTVGVARAIISQRCGRERHRGVVTQQAES